MSLGEEMFKGGLVIPKYIGWSALAVGVGLMAGGMDLYYDLRGRIDRLADRLEALEAAGPSQIQALNAIRDEVTRTGNELAGLRGQINILLQERWRSSPPAAPYP